MTANELREEWRPIVGYEGIYEVSNTGAVRSLDRITHHPICGQRKLKGKIMKVWWGKHTGTSRQNEYPRLMLTNGKQGRTFMIHVLVAQAFVPNPLGKRFVNHIDGDKQNPCSDNLEWVGYSENMKHAYLTGLLDNCRVLKGRKGEDNYISKLNNVDILMIRVLWDNGFSKEQIAKRFKVHAATIGMIVNNKTWKHIPLKQAV